jgi:YHS domain-containing protein
VPEVYALLHAHGAALVVADHPKREFQTLEATADWIYLRFHYGRRGREGSYSPMELRRWAERIAAWRARGDVFAYFNNDWQAFAVENAFALRRAVASKIPTAPSPGCFPGARPPPPGPRPPRHAAWHGACGRERPARRTRMEIDVVCGMEVDPTDAPAQTERDGKLYYFCSEDCLRAFEEDPDRYGAPATA